MAGVAVEAGAGHPLEEEASDDAAVNGGTVNKSEYSCSGLSLISGALTRSTPGIEISCL